jgi:hypothetical protein
MQVLTIDPRQLFFEEAVNFSILSLLSSFFGDRSPGKRYFRNGTTVHGHHCFYANCDGLNISWRTVISYGPGYDVTLIDFSSVPEEIASEFIFSKKSNTYGYVVRSYRTFPDRDSQRDEECIGELSSLAYDCIVRVLNFNMKG